MHSPLVGPTTTRALADALADRGWTTLAPDLRASLTSPHAFATAASRVAQNIDVLIGHSGAGAVLPAIAHNIDATVTVFIDAIVPPATTTFTPTTTFIASIDRLTMLDGTLPPWNEWWPPEVLARLVPDEQVRAALIAENPRLPRAFYDAPVVFPDLWWQRPTGYVQLSVGELFALGDALRRSGHGIFQVNSDHKGDPNDRAWTVEFVERTGVSVSYILSQVPKKPRAYQDALEMRRLDLAAGNPIVPMVSCRPAGVLFGLQSSLHPFITHPTWRALEPLAHAARVEQLRDPQTRAQLLSERRDDNDPRIRELIKRGSWDRWDSLFRLGQRPDYEPDPATSVAATAAASGRSAEAVALDWLLEQDGTALLFAPMSNYADGNHDAILEMIDHPGTVVGLSDAGAHCASICDASSPTYMLTHWVKGRARGPRLSLERAVHLQTKAAADLYGFRDRGVVAAGMRADLNVIDLEGLELHAPQMVFDLPTGAPRLVQGATGYLATFVAGELTMERGRPTGARPGRLARA